MKNEIIIKYEKIYNNNNSRAELSENKNAIIFLNCDYANARATDKTLGNL